MKYINNLHIYDQPNLNKVHTKYDRLVAQCSKNFKQINIK